MKMLQKIKHIFSHGKNHWSELLLLVAVFALAFALRMYRIHEAPKGALIDEAHFGYLAWSILETGRDEHGVFLPLNFKGFGDDKLPLQVYMLVPVVKFFGLSVATIRYPTIFLGSFLTIVVYFLFRRARFVQSWSLFAAFLVAISPWTFILSRFGFESNIALFFFTVALLGIVAFLDKRKQWWLHLSALSMGLTWYAYIAYRPITVVLIAFFFGFLYWNTWITKKQIGVYLLIFAVTIVPLFHPSVIGNNSTRVSQVGIFNDPILALEVDEFRNFCVSSLYMQKLCYAVANKYVVAFRIVLSRYIETFSPQFLGTVGENTETFLTVAGFGQFYSILYPFFILGIVVIIMSLFYLKLEDKKMSWATTISVLILIGLLITPLPSVLVGDSQKVRISPLFPFILLTIVLGARFAFESLVSMPRVRQTMVVIFMGIMMVQASQFFVNWYGVHAAKEGEHYQNFLPDLFTYLETHQKGIKTIIRPFFSDPTMFYAFYTKVHPVDYQQYAVLGELEASGFQHTVEYKNIFVREASLGEIGCTALKEQIPTLFITKEHIAGAHAVYTGYTQNGVHALVYVYDAPGSVDAETCTN